MFRLKVIYCKRSVVNTYGLPVPGLVSGFTSGEGSFTAFLSSLLRGLTDRCGMAAAVDGHYSPTENLKHELKCMY